MRGKQIPKRKIAADAQYGSEVVSKLINYTMQDGKKTVATQNVYKALDQLAAKTKAPAVEALQKALENIMPKQEIRARRVGGANYQVPVPVSPERQLSLAMRWLVEIARKARGSKGFWQALSSELFLAYSGEGDAVRKREDVQRMAESNRAFAQFA